MNIPVVSFLMKHFYNGSLVRLYYLRQEAGTSRLLALDDLAAEIEETSSLSKGDVVHVAGILMTEVRKALVRGDRVKIPDLGTFYLTLSGKGVEREEELSVRNIRKVNVRFLPDKALKLVNSALSPTRSTNNVSFAIKSGAEADVEDGKDGDSPGDGGGVYIDPNT
jgi:predicted histone-like DNA-binding protein